MKKGGVLRLQLLPAVMARVKLVGFKEQKNILLFSKTH
jgi:hypothetical protein